MGLTLEEAESGIGRIEFDGDFNTTYTKLLSNCNSKELLAIAEEGLNFYLFDELGIENAETLHRSGWLRDALDSGVTDLETYGIEEK